MCDGFSFFAIFLCGELEVYRRCRVKLRLCDGRGVDVSIRCCKRHVHQSEWMIIPFVVCIFAWSQHKEETNDHHANDSLGERLFSARVGGMLNELNRNGLDSFRWRVLLFICSL